MVYLLFSPNYGLEVDLSLGLAYGTDTPPHIDEFWRALPQVAFSQQPAVDGGFSAINLPADLLDVGPDIQAFWQALRPTIVTILAEHPTLVRKRGSPYGKVPTDPAILAQFGHWMNEKDPGAEAPRWRQLFDARPDREQSYAVWVLKQFFDYCTGPGMSI